MSGIGEAIISTIISTAAIEGFKKIKNNYNLIANKDSIDEALNEHYNRLNNLSKTISFRDLNKQKALDQVYTPLDFYTFKQLLSETDKKRKRHSLIKIARILSETEDSIVISGEPGAGKTTSLKFLFQEFLKDQTFFPKADLIIFIRFRELVENSDTVKIPLFSELFRILGLTYEKKKKQIDEKNINNYLNESIIKTIVKILNESNFLLFLDGYDEISNEGLRHNILSDIERLTLSVNSSRFILTTRKGDDDFHLNYTQKFEIAPLTDDQILLFSTKWLPDKANIFLEALKNSPVYEISRRPLIISHLCAIFENDGKIPNKPKTIYSKIINLLVEDWNNQNRVTRPSINESFTIERKRDFLENYAYELTFTFNRTEFDFIHLEKCFELIREKFGFEQHHLKLVVRELQIETGLIKQTRIDRYEFDHKSIQEFLCASYLVKLPLFDSNFQFVNHPDIAALCITLSSEPSSYFDFFIKRFFLKEKLKITYFNRLVQRLKIEVPDFIESENLAFTLIQLYDFLLWQKFTDQVENPSSTLNEQDSIFNNLLWSDKIKSSFHQLKRRIAEKRENQVRGLNLLKVSFLDDNLRNIDTELALSPFFYNLVFN